MRRYTRLMTVSPPLPVEIVSQSSQLDVAVKAMLGSRDIALDTESNSFHHYPEQLCLIQIATRQRIYIIDTIVLKELDSLKEVQESCSWRGLRPSQPRPALRISNPKPIRYQHRRPFHRHYPV